MQYNGRNYFANRHTLDPGGGVKTPNHFFLKVAMLHIRLEGIEHRAPCKQIFCSYTQLRPL